jgi:hypothetical protein
MLLVVATDFPTLPNLQIEQILFLSHSEGFLTLPAK